MGEQGRRTLTSVATARNRLVPPPVRAAAARREMERRSPQWLAGRTALIPLALQARRPGEAPAGAGGAAPNRIWQYWNSGAQDAPAVVRMALASVDRHAWAPVIRLTDASIHDVVDIPPAVSAKRGAMTATHFSDLLRLLLLAEHGGTWLDATVMLTGPRTSPIAEQPFFAFTRPEDPFLLSSWYIHCRPGDPVVCAWRDLLIRYWETHDTLSEYFLVHFAFEALVTCQEWVRRRWLATPVATFEGPHRLQGILQQPYREPEVTQILQSQWLHKLTYKFGEEPVQRPTVLDHLVSGA